MFGLYFGHKPEGRLGLLSKSANMDKPRIKVLEETEKRKEAEYGLCRLLLTTSKCLLLFNK